MTINAPASLLLLLYELVAEEQGVARRRAARHGAERHPQGVHRARELHLPAAAVDAADDRPLRVLRGADPDVEHDLDLRLPHPRGGLDGGAGARVHARERDRLLRRRRSTAGLSPDEFGARLSFFFNAHNDFFQEVAKFRAARRLWARIMRERFGATNPKALALRFHAQTGGSTLTAQQPENNVVRVAIQALSAVCGGAQSLHTNSLRRGAGAADRARGDDRAAHAADPRARGGHDRHRRSARRLVLHRVADRRARGARLGADRAHRRDRRRRRGGRAGLRPVRDRGRRLPLAAAGRVGRALRSSASTASRPSRRAPIELQQIDPDAERSQLERTAQVRAGRNAGEAARCAGARPRGRARHREHALPMREALRARCTIGEICGVLRGEWGEHDRERTARELVRH